MDSIYKIKRACYKPSSLTPGCLFAWSVKSPYIRLYLGLDSSGNPLFRVVRAHGRDVSFPSETIYYFPYNSAHIVVLRGE